MIKFIKNKQRKEKQKMNYAQKIKDLREDNDLLQKDVAIILKTTQQYYSNYEKGKRPLPIEHLITLCRYYNVSADYILGLPKGLKYPER